jgi:hypothetical protein
VRGQQSAWPKTNSPINAARARLWRKTYRNSVPSCPYQLVTVLATTMLWASIILPMTPPKLLAAAIRMGLKGHDLRTYTKGSTAGVFNEHTEIEVYGQPAR